MQSLNQQALMEGLLWIDLPDFLEPPRGERLAAQPDQGSRFSRVGSRFRRDWLHLVSCAIKHAHTFSFMEKDSFVLKEFVSEGFLVSVLRNGYLEVDVPTLCFGTPQRVTFEICPDHVISLIRILRKARKARLKLDAKQVPAWWQLGRDFLNSDVEEASVGDRSTSYPS